LSEKGKYDEIHGEGRVPDRRRDFPLPNWLKKKKKSAKVVKYYE